MDLPLILAIDLVEEIESKDMLADRDLIPVLEDLFPYPLAVNERPVPRPKICENELDLFRLGIEYAVYPSVPSG